jgi:hypothetical protein
MYLGFILITTFLHYIHKFNLRFTLEGVAEASQIFLRDAHGFSRCFFDKPIAVFPANRAPSGRRRSLYSRRPVVTGGRGVTPRGVAVPPGPPGEAGCLWLRTHHSSRLPARYD